LKIGKKIASSDHKKSSAVVDDSERRVSGDEIKENVKSSNVEFVSIGR
jgi:hypothetical protein